MSVFDEGQHGAWGMTYKYHERAIVFNERNLHRVWDVAYDGYVGGKDMTMVDMNNKHEIENFVDEANNYSVEYSGQSIISTTLKHDYNSLPSPLSLTNYDDSSPILATADTMINDVNNFSTKCMKKTGDNIHQTDIQAKITHIYRQLEMNNNAQIIKDATMASASNESTSCRLMYQGTSKWMYKAKTGSDRGIERFMAGCGHHGNDYVGVAAVRNGKQLLSTAAPHIGTTTRITTSK